MTIEDVAHALSHLCRFNGHSAFFYSVGQHSVLVSNEMVALVGPAQVRRRLRLLGLLHDAAEAYVGDVVSPIKRHAADFFGPLEAGVQAAIFEALGVDPPTTEESELVEHFDLRALSTEKRDLHQLEPQSWGLSHAPFERRIHYQNPEVVRAIFLEWFRDLR